MKQTNFRKITSYSGTIILAGRDAESNENLIGQVGKSEEVFHTASPGSPFVNIKGKAKKSDIKEAALFCAIYSRDWKKNKKDIVIHRFKGRDIFKECDMKQGTFGVKNYKIIKLKKEEIKQYEELNSLNKK